MRWQAIGSRALMGLAVAVGAWFWATPARAQTSSSSSSSSSNNNQPSLSGIEVNAMGVVERKMTVDPGGQGLRERIAAQRASLNRDVLAPSKSRKISLTRLEKKILDNNGVLTEEMRYLAGLHACQRVLLSGNEGPRDCRPGRRLGGRSRGTHRRDSQRPARRAASRPGGRAAAYPPGATGWS